MYLRISIVAAFLCTITGTSQELQGLAKYQTYSSISIQADNSNLAPEMVRKLEEALKKSHEKEFLLKFNQNESLYEEQEQLDKPTAGGAGGLQIVAVGVGETKIYKNVKEEKIIKEENILGKEFLVIDFLERPDWKLGKKTKKIGQYTCYNATLTQQREVKNWSAQEGTSTKIIEEEITAWYTPEIPVSQGPTEYWGLPGLILEIQREKSGILCTEVVINPKEAFEIIKPTKGKKIDVKSFEKLRSEKIEEKMEQLNKGKKADGIIRING